MLRLFDLPAHPLLIHFPIVAIPTLSIVALFIAFRPSFRERYGLATSLLGIVTTITTFLAASSGQALSEEFGFTEEVIGDHQSLGETLRLFVLGLTIAVIAVTAVGRQSGEGERNLAAVPLGIITLGFSALSIVWVIRTGHAGASSVWGGF